MSDVDVSFRAMGTGARIIAGPALTDIAPAAEAVARAREWVEAYERTLSRFDPESELSRLNANPAEQVACSSLMIEAIEAAKWTAECTDGLVDPTVIDDLETRGYVGSLAGHTPPPLGDLVGSAGPRRCAAATGRQRWRLVETDLAAGIVRRPRGLRIDFGGIGKGFAADILATQLAGYERYLVDFGGDMRIGGPGAALRPFEIQVLAPGGGGAVAALRVSRGAVATSGVDRRAWQDGEGYAHHLIDPATGRSVFSGVVSSTALADTGLEAEGLAKAALLAGSERGAELLARRGGILILDFGEVVRSGPVDRVFGPAVSVPPVGAAA